MFTSCATGGAKAICSKGVGLCRRTFRAGSQRCTAGGALTGRRVRMNSTRRCALTALGTLAIGIGMCGASIFTYSTFTISIVVMIAFFKYSDSSIR